MRSLHEIINTILRALSNIKLNYNCIGATECLDDILKKFVQYLCHIDIPNCFDKVPDPLPPITK